MLRDKHNLVSARQTGVDEIVDKILSEPTSPEAVLYKQAEALGRNPTKKMYVEAALITGSSLESVSDVLELRLELLRAYHYFFFDMVDVDRLTKIDHIDNLRDKNEAVMKLWALNHGLDFLAWRLGKKVTISPVEGLQDLFSTCIYKAKEAIYASSTSEQSKESVKWTKLSMDLARIIKSWVMDSSEAKRDLEIAIANVVPEFAGLDSLLEENRKL